MAKYPWLKSSGKNTMTNNIIIKKAQASDDAFIFSLSPLLAQQAKLTWHSADVINKMQADYIAAMLADTEVPNATFIASLNDKPLGFIHVRAHQDSISNETCGTVPLLATAPEAQGMGIGKQLIEAAEKWSKDLGYRLLHLEVFANNDNAYGFYQKQGFQAETIHMIKPI